MISGLMEIIRGNSNKYVKYVVGDGSSDEGQDKVQAKKPPL